MVRHQADYFLSCIYNFSTDRAQVGPQQQQFPGAFSANACSLNCRISWTPATVFISLNEDAYYILTTSSCNIVSMEFSIPASRLVGLDEDSIPLADDIAGWSPEEYMAWSWGGSVDLAQTVS